MQIDDAAARLPLRHAASSARSVAASESPKLGQGLGHVIKVKQTRGRTAQRREFRRLHVPLLVPVLLGVVVIVACVQLVVGDTAPLPPGHTPSATMIAADPRPLPAAAGMLPVPPPGGASAAETQAADDRTLHVASVTPRSADVPPVPPSPATPAASDLVDRSSGARVSVSAIRPLIQEVAARHAVPPALVEAVIRAESGFDPRAVSRRGASGLMQLMPATAELLGVRDVFDVRQNIEGGVSHLRTLIDRYGELRLALAAYNAGEKAVDLHRGVPPFSETLAYVDRVLRFYRQPEPGSSVLAAMSKPKWTKPATPKPRWMKPGLARYEAPDGTVVYTNLPAGDLPVSTKELFEGRKDEESEVVAFRDQID